MLKESAIDALSLYGIKFDKTFLSIVFFSFKFNIQATF